MPAEIAGAVSPGLYQDKEGSPTYRVGTLVYTRPQLTSLFLWLLGGDFAFTFFEQIFGRFIPLFAKELHGSDTLVGVMTGSIAGLVNLFFLPSISVHSDRLRGPWGRRIPFLLLATPCTVMSLLLVGFAPEIGRWTYGWFPPRGWVSGERLVLGLLCAFVVSYHFWNMVLNGAYGWLIRDVVPGAVVGRFLSWFRVVTTLSSFVFLWCVFPHVVVHRQQVFVVVGAVYALIFLLMCRRVREGAYPPPEPAVRRNVVGSFVQYFRRCLSVPIYRQFFLVYVLVVAATTCVNPFVTLFARSRLGLEMGELGKIFAWGALTSALAYLPMGWVCDRFKPIYVALAGLAGMTLASLAAYFFVHDRTGWWVYTVVSAVPLCAWGLGWTALSIELLPAAEFAQFSGGMNVFGYGGLVVGNYLVGALMDRLGSRYEMAFVWSAAMSAGALVPLWQVRRGWRRYGGPDGYVAPSPMVD